MKIKEMYYYVFYKIYKFWDKSDHSLLSTNFKAEISLIAVKIWFIGGIGAYISFFTNPDLSKLNILNPYVFLPMLFIIGTTLYFITFSNKWRMYFNEFDRWPKRKNKIGGIIVWWIIAMIFINVFISVELLHSLINPTC